MRFPFTYRPHLVASKGQNEQVTGERRVGRIRRFLRTDMLERRLFLTVLAGLLPVALLAFATLLHNAKNQKRELIEATGDTMRAVATAVDSELKISLASLDALSASPRLAAGDFAGFHQEARELLGRRPGWASIILSTPSSQQLVNTRLPFGAPLSGEVEPESIQEAVRSGKPGIGNMVFSSMLRMYVFTVQVPVMQDREVAYVLTAVILPEAIRSLLQKQRVPEHGVVTIIDRHANIVARSRSHDESVGKASTEGMKRMLAREQWNGWGITNTLEGRPVYAIYHRSPVTEWVAVVGIPTEILDRPLVRSYVVLGGAILVSVLIGFAAAFFASRSITKPLRELEQAAVDVGQGEPPSVPASELPEIRQVARALTSAHAEHEKLLQREREARMHAESVSRAKDEFLAMLGHELRNPLAAITTASEILELAERMPSISRDKAGEARAIIRRQSHHLARLTDDLLDAGRVVLGKVHLDRKPVNLADVIRGTMESLRNTGRLQEHELELSLETAWVEADITRLDQVVANLVTNALKYTPPPGFISVTLRREGAEAVLRVRDSGIGLEPELQGCVFDLFVQGQRSLERSQGGLGVGLTLVRRIAELHGGSVEVASDGPGTGCEFTVRLPLMEQPVEPSPCAGGPKTSGRLKIVVIEDNEDFRTGLRGILQADGHEVFESVDGAAGVEAVLREDADVALVDVGLPVLDGFGVAQAIRSRGALKVRLIAMTGYGAPDDMQQGLRSGFDAYLVKPLDIETLHATIAGFSGSDACFSGIQPSR
ncbi:response regulator [Herbaspirillum sp. HC18]|nr:response regulator [Herbaspirillum sp. HC18]